MPLVNDKQFQMRVSPKFLARIDDWRRGQPDLPGRSESIRQLVEIALGDSATIGTTSTEHTASAASLFALLIAYFEEDPSRREEFGIQEHVPAKGIPEALFFEACRRKRPTDINVTIPARKMLQAFADEPGEAAAAIRGMIEPLTK